MRQAMPYDIADPNIIIIVHVGAEGVGLAFNSFNRGMFTNLDALRTQRHRVDIPYELNGMDGRIYAMYDANYIWIGDLYDADPDIEENCKYILAGSMVDVISTTKGFYGIVIRLLQENSV